MNRTLLTMAAAILVVAGGIRASAATAEGSFQRTLEVRGLVDLDVRTGSGSIVVRTGPSDTVQIIGRIRAQDTWFGMDAEERVRRLEARPPIEQNGNTIRIGRIADRDLRNNISISYAILAPAETRLGSQTGSGHLVVEGIHGPVSAATGSGNLTIASIGDQVGATTGSGDVLLARIAGSVKTTSGSGDIRALEISGGLNARTGSGDVQASMNAPGDAAITTGSGDIAVSGIRGGFRSRAGSGDVTIAGEPMSAWSVSTGSGDILARIPKQTPFDLRAENSSGRITTAHPLTDQSTGRHSLEGKAQGGGPLVALSAGFGNIRIE